VTGILEKEPATVPKYEAFSVAGVWFLLAMGLRGSELDVAVGAWCMVVELDSKRALFVGM
jgi:hypothetical protein